MVSSLLFGETCTVLASEGEWLHVRVDHDGYLGWIPDLYLGDARPFQGQSWQVVRELGAYFLGDDGDVIALSPGSKIPGERIIIEGRTYYFRLGKYLVAGILAYFSNTDGKVVHVGILLDDDRIIHAYGKVRIDQLTPQGIVNTVSGELTHKLSGLRLWPQTML